MMKNKSIDAKGRKSVAEQTKITNNTIMIDESTDAKIKRKIIEKYSKNPKNKFKIHQNDIVGKQAVKK
jgi:hypothetical protein